MTLNSTSTAPVIQFTDNVKYAMSAALLANAVIINGVKYLEIPVEMLALEPAYQRIDRGHGRAIAEKWDRRKAGTLTVSCRDGIFYVIDGQHRLIGAKIVNEKSLTCQVYEGLTLEQEAFIFASQMEDTRKLTAQERFSAMLVAKHPHELAIAAICERYNIVILPKHSSEKPVLKGLCAAETAYKVYGRSCLEFIFSTIKAAGWHMVKGAYSDLMIGALRNIFVNHRHELDYAKKRLAVALEHTDLDRVKAWALCSYVGRGDARAVTALFEKCIGIGTKIGLEGETRTVS